jgi:ATP-dependent Lon protease
MVSAITGRPVKPALAVSGEVSLHGEVLGVGGLVYKIKAAVDAGRQTILVPAENAGEIGNLPTDLLARTTIVPVRTVFEAVDAALLRETPPLTSAEE